MCGGVVVGEDRAPLEADAGVPAEIESFLHHHVRPGENLVHTARIVRARKADVVAEFLVNDSFAREGFFHVDDGGQFLPLGLDQRQRILGLGARLGDHRRHRLALPAGALDRDRVLRRRLDAFQVREDADPGRAKLGNIFTRKNPYHARRFQATGKI